MHTVGAELPHVSPGHQQPRYWLGRFFSCPRLGRISTKDYRIYEIQASCQDHYNGDTLASWRPKSSNRHFVQHLAHRPRNQQSSRMIAIRKMNGGSTHKGPVIQRAFPCRGVIMVFRMDPLFLFQNNYFGWRWQKHFANSDVIPWCEIFWCLNIQRLTIKSAYSWSVFHMIYYELEKDCIKAQSVLESESWNWLQWASCQIRKIAGAHAPGMPGTFSPSPQVSDPDMHHGTCVTHVPCCMPGSLINGFIWNRRRGKTFPAFPAHAQPAILCIW